MKQAIVKDRKAAERFCNEGRISCQRAAYWKEGRKALKMEKMSGVITWRGDVGGEWWSATKTIGDKLGIRRG